MVQGKIEYGDQTRLTTSTGEVYVIPDGAPLSIYVEARPIPTVSSGLPGAPRNPGAPVGMGGGVGMGGMGGMGMMGMGGMAGMALGGGGGGANLQSLMDRIMTGGAGSLPPAGQPAMVPGGMGKATTGKAVIGQVAFPSGKAGGAAAAPGGFGGGGGGGAGLGGFSLPPDIEARLPPPMARFVPPEPVETPRTSAPLVIDVEPIVEVPKPEAPKPEPVVVPVVPVEPPKPAEKKMEWITGFFVADRRGLKMTSRLPPADQRDAICNLAPGTEVRLLDPRPETRVFTHHGKLTRSNAVPKAPARCLWPVNILLMGESEAKWRRSFFYWYANAKVVMSYRGDDGAWVERDLPALDILVDVADAKVVEKTEVESWAEPAPEPPPVPVAVLPPEPEPVEEVDYVERVREILSSRASAGDVDADAATAALDALDLWAASLPGDKVVVEIPT